ncbi:MAG: isopeptide-forming domain-containing fimbrial protein [Ruminococcus sp.]|nr:isopeptide-forming domain-containing fimbrial protein [Ruminococcus sp.]
MKNFKKFTAAIAATLMAASLSIPMATSFTASAASITINGISTEQAHTFEVYQVLTGTLDEAKKLNDMKWGSGVTSFNGANVTTGKELSKSEFEAISAVTDARTLITGDAPLLVLSETKACEDVTSANGTVTINDLDDGYYIVKDTTNLENADDANSAWIVQVADNATVDIKNAKPTVDKQIADNNDGEVETGDNNGWGETADHAINESFQFKLTATIPADADLAAYETYKLTFNDTMSAGVTFDSIESVKVGDTTLTTAQYAETATAAANKAGLSWTLSIEDVKAIAGASFGTAPVTVEVIYNAHLNENAIVSKESVDSISDINKNTVSLSYSNNPDSTGTGTTDGKTTEDTVWAFTYEVDNTKYANSKAAENILAGAEFNLKNAEGTPITFKLVDGFYIPDASGSATLTSAEGTGQFNIKGLDAGTYTLTETKTPDDYNKCDNITVVIKATHEENADEASAKLSLEGSSNMVNDVINKSGSTLPSTGGIGTTLFYLGGGCMVAVAGIFLITKKRMSKNAE